jgi:hypothetical protein
MVRLQPHALSRWQGRCVKVKTMKKPKNNNNKPELNADDMMAGAAVTAAALAMSDVTHDAAALDDTGADDTPPTLSQLVTALQGGTVEAATAATTAYVEAHTGDGGMLTPTAPVAPDMSTLDMPRAMPSLISAAPVAAAKPVVSEYDYGGFDLSGWPSGISPAWPNGAPPRPSRDAVYAANAICGGDPALFQAGTKNVLSIACYFEQCNPTHNTYNVYDWGEAIYACTSLSCRGTTPDHKMNASSKAADHRLLVIMKSQAPDKYNGGRASSRGGGRAVYRDYLTHEGLRRVQAAFARLARPVPLWLSDPATAWAEHAKANAPAKPVDTLAARMAGSNTRTC